MNPREIKFRAWDGSKMRYPSNDAHLALFHGDGRVPWRIYSNRDGAMLTDSQYGGALMQFTGLRDKNDREIYEGDIIRKANGHWGVIVFKAPHFEVTVSETQSSLYTKEWIEDSEVIGNVHENPELLKP